MKKFILNISMQRSKKYFCQKYGDDWFYTFKKSSSQNFKTINAKIPNIGKSVFSMNYQFAPAYIAWYLSLRELNLTPEEIDKNIWTLNENLMMISKPLLKLCGKIYFNGFKRKALKQIRRQKNGQTHPYDWKIDFKEIDKNSFESNIYECAFKKLARDFHVEAMLPGICRMDYLTAHLMGNGFIRTKTLGDGDDRCNCQYFKTGDCDWSPERGFTSRK